MNLTPDVDLATAIFYGVRTDTRALSRDSSTTDQYVYFRNCYPCWITKNCFDRKCRMPQEYFQAFLSLGHQKVFEKVIVSYQGAAAS